MVSRLYYGDTESLGNPPELQGLDRDRHRAECRPEPKRCCTLHRGIPDRVSHIDPDNQLLTELIDRWARLDTQVSALSFGLLQGLRNEKSHDGEGREHHERLLVCEHGAYSSIQIVLQKHPA